MRIRIPLGFSALLALGCCLPSAASPAPQARTAPYTPKKVAPRPADERIDQAVRRLLQKADDFWHQGDYESVTSLYYVVTDLDPSYLEGWQNYGWLLWSGLERDDAAMRVFQRGLVYHPDAWELYFEIAYLEQHRGNYLSAAQWYAKATNHNPPRHVWHARAHALEYAGLVDRSKAVWKTIIAKYPDNAVAAANLQRLEEGRIRNKPFGAGQDPGPPAPRNTEADITDPVDPDSI